MQEVMPTRRFILQMSKMQHIGHVHIQVSLHMALHTFSLQLQLIFPLPLEQQHVNTYFQSYYIDTYIFTGTTLKYNCN